MDMDGGKEIIKKHFLIVALFIPMALLYCKPVLWMVGTWNDKYVSHYTPGPWVLFLSLWVVYLKLPGLRKLPAEGNAAGLYVIIFAFLLDIFALRADLNRIALVSLVIFLFGFILYFFGKNFIKALWFPMAYLLFMVPMGFLDSLVGLPLRFFVTDVSAAFFNMIDSLDYVKGTVICLKNIGPLNIDAPCSGLNSMISLAAVGAVFSYLTQKTVFRKWLLFLLSLPIAVAANIMRVILIGMVAQGISPEIALVRLHYFWGFFVFALALAMFILSGYLIRWKTEK
ncbi:MAG: exosortase/archaeosortase family protein [Candidatus Aureabacteria bacterium]|nr:exosortase/archaeosortase family protein [Candidatus Auribacterota bacterium]